MPLSWKSPWEKQTTDQLNRRKPEDDEYAQWAYEKEVEIVGMMNRAGVEILAGTDAGNAYDYEGFSLHDELGLLVSAGLTPAEALRSATLSPARFLAKERDLGTISTGKSADLVLLDANPLKDIRNTARINAVVINGLLLDRVTLDKMLSQVEATASSQETVK